MKKITIVHRTSKVVKTIRPGVRRTTGKRLIRQLNAA